ncbi:GDP-mannose 4,6-dehydratase [Selenomonas sp. KH1T6]|uniref:GDP-mannose 4,6-dehydratase n=1 Tax=Selenomonas sp. KH1T6 TaxID=3158784 RepID=UPI0008A7324A|nr:GDP-4-dehydro-6-deoxy-D-mannose reductase [Selenomonas ruminantium]
MKILITGAAGFVGGHLIRAFAGHGHELAALDLGTSPLFKEYGVSHHQADLLDGEAMQEVFRQERPEAIVHLAAIANVPFAWEHPAKTMAVNVGGTATLLETMAKCAPEAKLLTIGSSDAYGLTAKCGKPLTEDMPCEPQNPYSISKLCAEQLAMQLAKKYSLNVIAARSFNHFGPGQKLGFVVSDFASQIAAIERGEQEAVLSVGDLTAARDFTYIDDIISAYVALTEKAVASGIYNICSGRPRKIEEVLQGLLACSSKEIEVRKDPARLRPSEVPFFVGDGAKLSEATGWKPVTDFQEGLQKTLDYWRKI